MSILPTVAPARAAPALLLAVAFVDLVLALATDSAFAWWWTSVGLAVALVAMLPVRRWPLAVAAVFAVGAGVRLAAGVDTDLALVSASTQATEGLVGALVLTRLGRRAARLDHERDLLRVMLASLACGVVALATPLLTAPGVPTTTELIEVAAQHSVSTLLLCSVALLGRRMQVTPGRTVELVLQVTLLTAVTAAVFAPDQLLPLLFAPIPLMVWGALRFDAGIVANQLVGWALAVTVATSRGLGPVAEADLSPDRVGAVVLAYLATVAVVVLPLALSVRERLALLERVSADERLFRRNFTESPLGVLLLRHHDGALRVDELNDAARTILAVGADDLTGSALEDLLQPQGPSAGVLQDLLDGTADSWHGHAAAMRRPGSRLEVAVSALDWRDGVRIYSAQVLDVTEGHDAHRRLLAAYRLNDATLDTTACLILVADAEGVVVRVNESVREITGYTDRDLVGRRLWDLPLEPLSRSETEAMFVWPNRSGSPMATERLGRTAYGDPLRVVWNHNVVRDESGMPSYAVLTGIDVTSERSTSVLVSHLLSVSISTALVGVDGRGLITLANAGAAHMLGWSVDELEGRPFVELFDQRQLRERTGGIGTHDAFLSLIGMIGDRDETPARDWTWRTRRGHDLIVSMTLSVTEDLGEGRLAFLCVGRDVTEQREGQETLVAALDKERTALERLRALDRAKDEFVSTVSHELRTPVTSIIGYTEMLRDGAVVDPLPEQLPMLDTIARNSERLIAICNDLLLLSGFESDATPALRTRIDLRDCVAAARESLSAPTEGPTIHVHEGMTPLEVTGDRSQLERLVANLLGNAIKFTPAGGRVDVLLDHHEHQAVLTVRDTGIGIAVDDHVAVFQRFYRTSEAQSQAIPGTGLGLPIVAAIVKAHDGEIVLESEPGRGTTFRVLLPLAERLHRLHAV